MAREKDNQVKVERPVQRTLNKIQFAKFSDKVMEGVSPITQANEKVRAKSLAKAGHHVLR